MGLSLLAEKVSPAARRPHRGHQRIVATGGRSVEGAAEAGEMLGPAALEPGGEQETAGAGGDHDLGEGEHDRVFRAGEQGEVRGDEKERPHEPRRGQHRRDEDGEHRALMRGAAEEDDHRDRDQHLHRQDAQHRKPRHPGEDEGVGIGPREAEAQQDQRHEPRLHQPRDMRRAMRLVHRRERFPRQPLVAERIEIAVERVVEREQAGKEAGQQQHVHHLHRPVTEHRLGGGEVETVEVLSRRPRHRGRAVELHDRPGRDRVEGSDQQHRDIGRARDGAVGIAGLLAEDRGGLEADIGAQHEDHGDAKPGAEDLGGTKARKAQPLGAAMHHDRDVEKQQDHQLGNHAQAEDAARDRDVAPPEKHDDGQHRQRPQPPRQRDAQAFHRPRHEHREERIDTDLDREIGEQCHQRAADPRTVAKPARDIGVKRPCPGHMPRHRGEAHREQQVEDARQDEGARHARAIAEGKGRRRRPHHRGHRRRRRDHEEHDMGQADRISLQTICACLIVHLVIIPVRVMSFRDELPCRLGPETIASCAINPILHAKWPFRTEKPRQCRPPTLPCRKSCPSAL
ncbi:hypothetical protein SDC9_51205 [bioreactor metagenome]|uniref:Uncharacterized protein n=1 Tax=bioreactor metagenome TaxID=1076179 RepID=A0A644WRP7_9ZZZZ